jgi:hypothetical protein
MARKIDINAAQAVAGSRFPAGDDVEYPDIDLRVREGTDDFVHWDGSPYVGG